MTSRRAKKAPSKKPTKAAAIAEGIAKVEAERLALAAWIDQNDPLLDHVSSPITISELLSTMLLHRTFSKSGMGEMSYNWERFRAALDKRDATSPRWYIQLREEDLLMDPDGLEGVVVDCFVVAEATMPTLSPSHYIVKLHWPYSDLEDNAPERIFPIKGQGMCWRQVVHDDGRKINAYLLQKKQSADGGVVMPATSFGFGATVPAPSQVAPANNSFGFGSSAPTSAPAMFGFGAAKQAPAAAPAGFGFGAAPVAATGASAFGFGFGTSVPSGSAAPTANGGRAPGAAAAPLPKPPVVTQLKSSEVLFALWSKQRIAEMAKSLKSGSRIVREDFNAGPVATKIKLVMQNDLKDDVVATVKNIILNKIYAKRCEEIKKVDKWIDDCPVYEESLGTALQKFRAKYVQEIAEESNEFHTLYQQCHETMEAELTRIIQERKQNVEEELKYIEEIQGLLKEKKIAEKNTFRLLKYYPKNDIQRFRPYGKVSGISEMGESADLCDPPPYVFVNPFALKSSP